MDIKKHDVGIATRLRTGESRVRIPVDVRDFPFLQKVQNSSGTNPAFYSIGTRALFLGLRPKREGTHPIYCRNEE
jgi:hypothetical protein